MLKRIKWDFEIKFEEIYEFFLNPKVSENYKIEWKEPNEEKLIRFMVDEHSFSLERVEKACENLKKALRKTSQTTLAFFK